MAINFPNAPTQGQTFSPPGGYQYIWLDGVWRVVEASQNLTAERRNRLVNPSMGVSQENGDTGSPSAATGSWFAADQWIVAWGLSGNATAGRTRPSDNGTDVLALTIGTATPSPPAGAYAQITQDIEGIKVKDFLWGGASAKQVVFRFSLYSTVAGTFSVQLKNAAVDRTFLAPFTVAVANQWRSYSVVIPGDTTGTWPTTTAKGMSVGLGLSSGTTYGGGVAGWQAGNRVQIAGNTNGAATAATFLFADAGFYLDSLNTGTPPRFEMPDEAAEEIACLRYYEKIGFTCYNSSDYSNTAWYRARKRTTPAFALISGALNGGVFGIMAYSPLDGMRQTTAAGGASDILYAASARM